MGHRYITYSLHNRSARTCTIVGFPGVQLLDGHGSPLPTLVSHSSLDTGPARRVLLVPNGWAFFTLKDGVISYGSAPEPCPTVTPCQYPTRPAPSPLPSHRGGPHAGVGLGLARAVHRQPRPIG
jgi:hypothetical protein